MNYVVLITLFVTAMATNAGFSADRKINLQDFKWVHALKQRNVAKINVCGNPDILNTKQSIGRDFLIGDPKKGYLFSDLITYKEYWEILESSGLEKAKAELTKRFMQTVLWQVSEQGNVNRIGTPSRVMFAMTATVRDCIEGARTTLGNDCSRWENRSACCKEKFVGPEIYWENKEGKFRLGYSPDPSIRLKVPNERNHRFCHSVDSIVF